MRLTFSLGNGEECVLDFDLNAADYNRAREAIADCNSSSHPFEAQGRMINAIKALSDPKWRPQFDPLAVEEELETAGKEAYSGSESDPEAPDRKKKGK